MTNTTNQKDSSAASGELVGEVKKDRSTGIPYIDWKRDHTLLPVGFKLYGARAPQAATPLPGQDERALFEKSMNDARFFPAELCFARTKSPSGRDEYANSHLQSCWVGWQARVNLTQQAAPEAPARRATW